MGVRVIPQNKCHDVRPPPAALTGLVARDQQRVGAQEAVELGPHRLDLVWSGQNGQGV